MKCWLIQKWISLLLEENRPCNRWVQSHLDHCPACRGYCQSQIRLSQSLRAQANTVRELAPPFLKSQVMASVALLEQAATARTAHTPLGRAGLWTAAAAVACALVIGFLWKDTPPASTPSRSQATAQWPVPRTHELARLSAFEHPLEKEMNLVIDDARTALLAVADSVLPSALLDR